MIPISFTNSVIKIIFSISFPLGKKVCDVSVGIPQCSITPKPFTVTMISQDSIRYSHFGCHNWCLGVSLLFKKFHCYWLFFLEMHKGWVIYLASPNGDSDTRIDSILAFTVSLLPRSDIWYFQVSSLMTNELVL